MVIPLFKCNILYFNALCCLAEQYLLSHDLAVQYLLSYDLAVQYLLSHDLAVQYLLLLSYDLAVQYLLSYDLALMHSNALKFCPIQAPEIYLPHHRHGTAADWFALGVTLHEFVTGRRPFETSKLQAFRNGEANAGSFTSSLLVFYLYFKCNLYPFYKCFLYAFCMHFISIFYQFYDHFKTIYQILKSSRHFI